MKYSGIDALRALLAHPRPADDELDAEDYQPRLDAHHNAVIQAEAVIRLAE